MFFEKKEKEEILLRLQNDDVVFQSSLIGDECCGNSRIASM
jgi:hypothetical protein